MGPNPHGLTPGLVPFPFTSYPTGRGSRNDHVCGPNDTLDGKGCWGQAVSWLRNADSPQITGLPQAWPYTLSTQQVRRGGRALGSGVHRTLHTGPNTRPVAERAVTSGPWCQLPLCLAHMSTSQGAYSDLPVKTAPSPPGPPSPLPIANRAPLLTGLPVSPTMRRWLQEDRTPCLLWALMIHVVPRITLASSRCFANIFPIYFPLKTISKSTQN